MSITTEIKLKDDVVSALRRNQVAKNRLALDLNKSASTIQRHLKENSEMLTTAKALIIISEELGIPQNELLDL